MIFFKYLCMAIFWWGGILVFFCPTEGALHLHAHCTRAAQHKTLWILYISVFQCTLLKVFALLLWYIYLLLCYYFITLFCSCTLLLAFLLWHFLVHSFGIWYMSFDTFVTFTLLHSSMHCYCFFVTCVFKWLCLDCYPVTFTCYFLLLIFVTFNVTFIFLPLTFIMIICFVTFYSVTIIFFLR